MDAALGSLLLNVLKELRDIITKQGEIKRDLIAHGTFIELYGSATRLQGYADRIHAATVKSNAPPDLGYLLSKFFDEVYQFGQILQNANFSAIEVFQPELAKILIEISHQDISLSETFAEVIAPQFDLDTKKAKNIVQFYADFQDSRFRDITWEAGRLFFFNANEIFEDPYWSKFEELSNYLEDFRKVIQEVIKETWDFEELATLPSKRLRKKI